MTQPTRFNKSLNYAGYASANPSSPFPPASVDTDLNALETTTDEICDNLALIQRDDGFLKNGSVHPNALSSATRMLIANWNIRGNWLTLKDYAVKDFVENGGLGYVAIVAHTSVTFSVDLASGYWMQVDINMAALAASSGSSLVGFIQAETGAVATTEQAQLRKTRFLDNYDTSSNYDSARDALTGKLALPPSIEIAPHLQDAANAYPLVIKTGNSTAADFNMGIFDSVSFGTRNTVLSFGYNITPGASRKDTSEPAWAFSIEANYNDGVKNQMEWHLQGIHGDGTTFRNWSWAIDRSAKTISNYTDADNFYLFNGTHAFQYFTAAATPTTATIAFSTGTSVSLVGGTASQACLLISGITPNTNTQIFGIEVASTLPTTATVVGAGFVSVLSTQATGVTYANAINFYGLDVSKGAGSTITTATGFWCSDLTTGVSNMGFRGLVSSGSNKYNLYLDGTAQNYLLGVTGIGIVPSSTSALALAAGTTGVASLRIPHGSAPTSPVNGDIWTTTAGIFVRINGATVGPLT